MLELTQSFTFEAAHFLPSAPEGDPNRRLHGHSFTVKVSITGVADDNGLVLHFDVFRAQLENVRQALDHRFLNDIAGLEKPTLENIVRYIHAQLSPVLPTITRINIARPSCGEECTLTC